MFEPLVGILEEASIDALRDPRAHTQVVCRIELRRCAFPSYFCCDSIFMLYGVPWTRYESIHHIYHIYLFVLYV